MSGGGERHGLAPWPILVIDDQIGQLNSPHQRSFLELVGGDPSLFEFATGQRGGKNDIALAVEAVNRGWPFAEGDRWSLVLLDVSFPSFAAGAGDDTHGFLILDALQQRFGTEIPVVMLTSEEGRRRESGVRKAKGFLPKENLGAEKLAQVRAEQGLFPDERGLLLGSSLAFVDVLRTLRRFARYGAADLLFLGESGTGKTQLARFFHDVSSRPGPFRYWYADPATKELHQDKLFGHWAGAFTGAETSVAGKAEQAHLGTLFIDEVSELAAETQVQLLAFRDRDADGRRSVSRLGSYREARRRLGRRTDRGESAFDIHGDHDPEQDRILVDVRCVFASNRDLRDPDERKAAGFRDDLFEALGTRLPVPPLRERREDILPLFEASLNRLRRDVGCGPAEVEDGAVERLLAHSWPGNIRELHRAAEHVSTQLGRDFDHVAEHQLPDLESGARKASDRGTSAQVSTPEAASTAGEEARRARGEAGELARRQVMWLADGVDVLCRAVEVTSQTWRADDPAKGVSPARIAEHISGTAMSTSLAKRTFNELLRPIFKPAQFQQDRWGKLKDYQLLRQRVETDPVLQALWRYVDGVIDKNQAAREIAEQLGDIQR